MPDFSSRSLLPERMDRPDASPNEIRQALKELELINRLLGGYDVILDALNQLTWNGQPVSIMDLGCGGGDLLRVISKWAQMKNRTVRLIGVDRNPVMTEYATEHSNKFFNISYRTCDIFDNTLMAEKPDIVMSTLFCHHFDDLELVKLMRRMKEIANRAIIINDLHRHWFAYYSIDIIAKLFSKTDLVKYDGPVSVARSLTKKEWLNIFSQAEISNYKIRWMWAWRWQIIVKT